MDRQFTLKQHLDAHHARCLYVKKIEASQILVKRCHVQMSISTQIVQQWDAVEQSANTRYSRRKSKCNLLRSQQQGAPPPGEDVIVTVNTTPTNYNCLLRNFTALLISLLHKMISKEMRRCCLIIQWHKSVLSNSRMWHKFFI